MKTREEAEKYVNENFPNRDAEAKERIIKFLLRKEKDITVDTTDEQNKMIARAIDNCPCCNSRAHFATTKLNISSQTLYKKLKGIRKFNYTELKTIESHFGISFDKSIG
ncbi:MAG: hypothetical protein MSA15_21395 [Clostridium sp.]|nr:hypothetical protein [Clostridium sp.]